MKIYSTSFSLNMFITNIGKNMKSYFVTLKYFLKVLVKQKIKR